MTEPEQPVVAVPERSTGVTEFAWLVERGQSMRQVPTVWWTGERVPNVEQWTTDANKAKKFASRDEAETQIEALSGFVRPGTDRFGIAVQHGFITSQAVAVPLRAALERERGLLDAMATWPKGANGPIAIVAYEQLVKRLRAALAVEAVRPETHPVLAKYGLETMGGDPLEVLERHLVANCEATLGALRLAVRPETEDDIDEERVRRAVESVWRSAPGLRPRKGGEKPHSKGLGLLVRVTGKLRDEHA